MWNKQINKYTNTNAKIKVLKRPNMCYIFEKHGIQGYQIWNEGHKGHAGHHELYFLLRVQGYQIWHSRVSNVKYTKTQTHKYANAQIQSA